METAVENALTVEFSDEFGIDEQVTNVPHKVWVWTKNDVEHCAQVANVLSVSKDHEYITVMYGNQEEESKGEEEGSRVQTFAANSTYLFDESHLLDWDDVAQMNNLHEPALISLLRKRYYENKIYSLSGDVIISINPYKALSGLYGKDVNFRKSDEELADDLKRGDERSGKFKPHLYSVAEKACEALVQDGSNQSILINGESGAGKTEAAKHIMTHLTVRSSENGGKRSELEKSVLQSNPLLEAFGNAQTIRNDNSSRFGKFVKIQYTSDGVIHGAQTQHFLLEKSRIVKQSTGERNYHIFYQLLAGFGDEALQELGLEAKGDYNFLQRPETNMLDDVEGFKDTLDALFCCGVPDTDINNIFGILAAILHLGNIKFVEVDDHAAIDENDATTQHAFSKACELLGLATDDLKEALHFRTIGARSSIVRIPLTPREAAHSRNGLAKTIYAKLFDRLVCCINKKTVASEGATVNSFIGILDIFGFEILQHNSFEQLCVNYANEVLQKLFNQHVFELERSRYESEGISWEFQSKTDSNEILIDLLDGPKTSVLAMLEEQGLLGSASDGSFIAQLNNAQKDAPHQLYLADRFGRNNFVIKHFAGQVEYCADGFLAKNNDALQHDLASLMTVKATGNDYIHNQLFPKVQAENEQPTERVRGGKKMASLQSVSVRFRSQMNELISVLSKTQVHFIRCVKPNENKAPGEWDAQLVLNQLRHLGVMEAVRIRQDGYPVSRTYSMMVGQYYCLMEKDKAGDDNKAMCREILEKFFQDTDWQLGDGNKVFLRKGVLPELNAQLVQFEEKQEKMRQEAERAEKERLRKEQLRIEREREEQLERERREKMNQLERERAEALERERVEAEERAKAEELERIRLETERKEQEEAEKQRKAEEERRLAEEEANRLREEEARQQALALEKLRNDIKSVTKLQAWWRTCILVDHYAALLKARNPWKSVLRDNEAVMLASIVIHTAERDIIKKIGLSRLSNNVNLERLVKMKKRRGLILTTGPKPRLLCVDPKDMTVINQADISATSAVEILSDQSFIVKLDGVDEEDWSLTDILGRSAPWARAIVNPLNVVDLMTRAQALRLDSTEPVVMQGYMKKRAIKSAKNWRERWFVLQGTELMWYKSQKQSTPQGSVPISESTVFEVQNIREHCFTITGRSIPEGLFVQCPDKRSQFQWLAALSGVQATVFSKEVGVESV